MKMWIDTEFNGFGGDLISLALVSADGKEFYEVLECAAPVEPWVQIHVMPYLNKDPIPLSTFQNKLGKYLKKFGKIELRADWPTDFELFCKMLITGPGHSIRTPPLTMEMITGLGDTATRSAIPHNALEDARAFRDMELGITFDENL